MFKFFDYNYFDVCLLYIFIRNFCFLLKLLYGWGFNLNVLVIFIGDDIECVRLFRNYFVYIVLLEMFDDVFNNMWKELKFLVNRI